MMEQKPRSSELQKNISDRIRELELIGLKGLKISDTFTSPIINYKNAVDKMQIEAFVFLNLKKLAGFYNVEKKPTNEQLEVTAEMCLEKFPYLSLEDYPVFVKNAVSGGCHANGEFFSFGKAYNHLDAQMILEWLSQYMGAKEATREALAKKQMEELNNPTKEGNELLHKIMKQYEVEKTPRKLFPIMEGDELGTGELTPEERKALNGQS